MAAAARETYYALACQHLAAAAHYLAGVAPGSPLRFGAAHLLPPLAVAGPLPHVLPPPPARPPHRRHEHRVEIREEDDGREDDEDDGREDNEDDGDGGGGGAIAAGGGADDDDEFGFAVHDLVHGLWPLLVAAPPYPLYCKLSDTVTETAGWVWYLFGNALAFTVAVTYFSVVVFRSSRRCLPTFLRAMLLAVTLGAEASAAFHLPPDSPLATILSYISIILHLFIYLLTWAAYCFWRRRRLHPLP